MVLFIAGMGLTIISLIFIFPYFGFYIIEQFENITPMTTEVTGLENPLNLFVFAVLFTGGLGLVAKVFS